MRLDWVEEAWDAGAGWSTLERVPEATTTCGFCTKESRTSMLRTAVG